MKKLLLCLLFINTSAFAQSPCNIGDFLFYDLSCGSKLEDGKYPIAIVFAPERRVAVSLDQEHKEWSNNPVSLEIMPPKGFKRTRREALQEFSGVEAINTFQTMAPNFYPAVMYCAAINRVEYRTWYLPELGLLNQIYERKNEINASLSKIEGSNPLQLNAWYWSASQYSYSQAWQQSFMNGYADYDNNGNSRIARCVINY